jgi:acetoin:2,6-dichlorophenolindophenol oxidoreductase subunit beta
MKNSKTDRNISFAEAINESLFQSMKKNKNLVLMGLGITDPKAIFGTTKSLLKIFGPKRVIETPTSENAITGIAIGSAINNNPVVLTHQRVEFALLSMDQIINQAAKWYFMTAKKKSVPIVIRLVIGRGWGQGPQHSQTLEVLFSHIPGLKVVCPFSAYDAKGMLNSAINDKNPVIFFEHRWLHQTTSFVPKKYYEINLDKAKVIKKGSSITLISFSFGVIECLKASEILNNFSIKCEIIDLRVLHNLDKKTIIKSVKKTKKVIIIDNGWSKYGISSEIMSLIIEEIGLDLDYKPIRLGNMQTSLPSSRYLAKFWYLNHKDIVKEACKIFKINFNKLNIKNDEINDVPNKQFTGPF